MNMQKQETLFTAGGNETSTATLKDSWQFLKKN